MTTDQMLIIILTILVPMLGGFGWLVHLILGVKNELRQEIRAVETKLENKMDRLSERIGVVEERLTIIETVLKMMGMPIKTGTER